MGKAKSTKCKDSCDEETALRNAQRSSVSRCLLLDSRRLERGIAQRLPGDLAAVAASSVLFRSKWRSGEPSGSCKFPGRRHIDLAALAIAVGGSICEESRRPAST